jgi:saxitoxin biosynthesis operon SxtJ-like protein
VQLLESEHDEVVVGPGDRNFGFTMATVFGLIGALGLYKGSSHAPVWLFIAAIFAGLTVWRPQLLRLANRAWLKLGLLMYRVVNPVIMAILFFGAILPIGSAMRLFGKDFLTLQWDRSSPTYWLPRSDPRPPSESMRQQF